MQLEQAGWHHNAGNKRKFLVGGLKLLHANVDYFIKYRVAVAYRGFLKG